MIFSMTGYAIATRELMPATPSDGATHAGATSVSVELRSVNSRFLDLHFRMADEVRACEPALRERLTAALSRGKVEIRVVVQRAESVSSGGLDHAALAQLATLQQAARAAFPGAEPLRVGDVLRWPGVMADSSVDGDVLRAAVLACGHDALAELLAMRGREGQALGAVLREHVAAMEAIVAGLAPRVPELVARHQQKIVERLEEALGLALQGGGTPTIPRDEVAERIRQEVTIYGVRIDIAEELTRLATHLAETRRMLDQGGKLGKRLDFMMQELNREANTVGSKAAAKELADAAMALKLLIEQMREQVQNLE